MQGELSPFRGRGFTLVELMIVLAIVVLTAVLGAPAFGRLLESTRIRTEATRLMSDVVLSRSEAIKRNRQVVICPATAEEDGGIACGGVFADGWVIFVDADRNGQWDEAEDVIRNGDRVSPGLRVTNRLATRDADESIRFRPDGSSRRNRTLMICSRNHHAVSSWSVVMNIIGRPRLARGWGACPGPGS